MIFKFVVLQSVIFVIRCTHTKNSLIKKEHQIFEIIDIFHKLIWYRCHTLSSFLLEEMATFFSEVVHPKNRLSLWIIWQSSSWQIHFGNCSFTTIGILMRWCTALCDQLNKFVLLVVGILATPIVVEFFGRFSAEA